MNKKPIILFGMAHAGFFRNFENVIVSLLEAGIDIHVHLSKNHNTIKIKDYCLPKNKMKGQLTFSSANKLNPFYADTASLRTLRDIIHYSKNIFKDATDLRTRFSHLQKTGALSLEAQDYLLEIFDLMPEFFKRKADRMLKKKEEAVPPSQEAMELVLNIKPDYVIVTPLINFASKEVDLVKAAQKHNIPTLLATASWDNLTNKGKIMVETDHVAVWNKAMAQEATRLHKIAQHKIWITGAPPFDHWFNRVVSRDKKTFCSYLGLDPAKAIIVYLCSSNSIAGENELDIINNWKKAINESDFKKLVEANILIRPHPMAIASWQNLLPTNKRTIGNLDRATIWPLNVKHPTSEQGRADLFDTLYHADAIVGLNTSTMIEAAILDKPVLTFLDHAATASQTGNLHFKHLEKGKFMFKANNLAEHISQLANVLESPPNITKACRKFIKRFVRPLGREVMASSQLASHILVQIQNKIVKKR